LKTTVSLRHVTS